MPNYPENHIFTGRLLVIAIITAIITTVVLVGLYETIEWMNHTRELVNAAYSPM